MLLGFGNQPIALRVVNAASQRIAQPIETRNVCHVQLLANLVNKPSSPAPIPIYIPTPSAALGEQMALF
ncbi:hypothetical protein OH686_19315 [Pseudomonas sp. SO81]|nr:hypothetical protein OH686_19315 [Pseudomonas sp. SO81]